MSDGRGTGILGRAAGRQNGDGYGAITSATGHDSIDYETSNGHSHHNGNGFQPETKRNTQDKTPLLSDATSSSLENNPSTPTEAELNEAFKEIEDALPNLAKRFDKSHEQLKEDLRTYWAAYKRFKKDAVVALIPEGAYFSWSQARGTEGFQSGLQTLNASWGVPGLASGILNGVLNVGDFGYNVHTFEPSKAAAIQAIEFANIKPEWRKFRNSSFPQQTGTVIKKGFQWSMTTVHNVTGAVANILELAPYAIALYNMGFAYPLGPVLGVITSALLTVLGYAGMRNYMYFCDNDIIYDGTDFFANEKKKPYLLGEVFYRNQLAVPFEVVKEGFSSIAIRTLSFAGIAAQAASVLGWWPLSPIATGAFVAAHTLFCRYQASYNRYMDHTIKIKNAIREHGYMENAAPPFEGVADAKPISESIIEAKYHFAREHFLTQRRSNKGFCNSLMFMEDTSILIEPLIQSAITSYFLGWQVLTPAIALLSAAPAFAVFACIAGPILGILAGFTPSYLAKAKSLEDELIYKAIPDRYKPAEDKTPEQKNQEVISPEMESRLFKLKILSYTVNAMSQTVRLFGNIGAADLIPGIDDYKISIAILALATSVNGFIWSQERVEKTFKARYSKEGWKTLEKTPVIGRFFKCCSSSNAADAPLSNVVIDPSTPSSRAAAA